MENKGNKQRWDFNIGAGAVLKLDIYQVIFIDPMYLTIESSLGEEGGGGWKNIHLSKQITLTTPKGAFARPNGQESSFLVELVLQ